MNGERYGSYIIPSVIQTHVTCIEVMELSSYETCPAPFLRGLSFLSMKPGTTLRAWRERPFDEMQIAVKEAGKHISIKSYLHNGTLYFYFLSSRVTPILDCGHALEMMPT